MKTTKQVRRRLDLSQPIPNDDILECIDIANHAPMGGNLERLSTRSTLPCYTLAMSRRNAAVADPAAGHDEEPKRFGVRDLRNDTASVLEEAERSGAVYITRHGEVVAKLTPHRNEPDSRTPTQRLLDRVAALPRNDTGWADRHADAKRVEIEAQRDDPWE